MRRLRLGAAAAAMLAEEPGLAPGAAVARAAVEASADARGAPSDADVAFVEAQLLRAGSRVRRLWRAVFGWPTPGWAVYISHLCAFWALSAHGSRADPVSSSTGCSSSKAELALLGQPVWTGVSLCLPVFPC